MPRPADSSRTCTGKSTTRRRHAGADALSALIAETDSGATLGRHDLLPMCALLLMAGYETTANRSGRASASMGWMGGVTWCGPVCTPALGTTGCVTTMRIGAHR